MTKTEARKLGNELKSKGMTYQELAVELGKRGYRTGQGKEPQWYDINYLLNQKRFSMLTKRRKLTHLQVVKPTPSNDMKTVKEIVFNNKLDATKKVEIIKIVLQPQVAEYPLDIEL